MKKQLQGPALILLAILLMLGFGDAVFFDFSCRWSVIFTALGAVGAAMVFWPQRK